MCSCAACGRRGQHICAAARNHTTVGSTTGPVEGGSTKHFPRDMWPAPRLAGHRLVTSCVEFTGATTPVSMAAVLMAITPGSVAKQPLAPYPFRFVAPRFSGLVTVVTANVLSARRLAIGAVVAAEWAEAARHCWSSREAVKALQRAASAFVLTEAPVDIDDALLPFACSHTCYALATCHLRLALCHHATDNPSRIASTAAVVWREAAALQLPAAWVPYRARLVTECKRVIADTFGRYVATSAGGASGLFEVSAGGAGPHDNVFDAMQCVTDAVLKMTLAEQWAVYERRGPAVTTPVADML